MLFIVILLSCFPQIIKTNILCLNNDCGEPLYLTPYVISNDVEFARNSSAVHLPKAEDIDSFSGFLTIDEETKGNLFFWFFPSKKPNAPLMLWLQGGPGLSSLLGLFVENGPFKVNENYTIERRRYSWTKLFSVLYIDNPVGTGFSSTENKYSRNQTEVAVNLLEALRQFFILFPEMKQNDFYIAGQSYGGKFTVSLAYMISKSNVDVKLKGIAIGNGFIDPVSLMNFSDLLFYVGLIDENQMLILKEKETKLLDLFKEEQLTNAYATFGEYFRTAERYSGYNYAYNFLLSEPPKDVDHYKSYIRRPEVRKALHVGTVEFKSHLTVSIQLRNEFLVSVKPLLEHLLNRNYKVMIYSGNLDIIVPTPLTEKFLRALNWTGSEEYLNATRIVWKNRSNKVIGYVKQAANLSFVVVKNAGHLVPYDQPRTAFEMIKRFVFDHKFESSSKCSSCFRLFNSFS